MRHYCTLFDQHYLPKGLALHESLMRHEDEFTLWVLALDETTVTVLETLAMPNVRIIRLREVEDADLRRVKRTRTQAEYCWTLTPVLPLYLLKRYKAIDAITYLDADLSFFSSPDPIFAEIGARSVAITSHRYETRYQHYETTSGKYNVQFLFFRNNREGRATLSWWRDRCIEWCYARFEDGKYGDQRYLDDWPERFRGVHVITHVGAGVAPWNVHTQPISGRSGSTLVGRQPLIFYHFHALALHTPWRATLARGYRFTYTQHQLIYRPYLTALRRQLVRIQRVIPSYQACFIPPEPVGPQLVQAIVQTKEAVVRHLRENRSFYVFLIGAGAVLLLINRWFWPTPDEYLYASVARSLIAGVQGDICLSCFNAEHTYLVPAVAALWASIAHPPAIDLAASRIPVFAFSLGTIALLWLIAKEVVKERELRIWWLWLLLLIPGFFVLSVRFLLDVPLVFGFALLVYLLIRRSRTIWIGLALMLILLIKDYGFYLALPIIGTSFVLDLGPLRIPWWKRLVQLVLRGLWVLMPSLAAIILLLGFNLLPFPRLLEAGLQEYFGPVYPTISRSVLSFLQASTAQLAELQLLSTEQVQSVAAISEKVHNIPVTSSFPTALLDSPLAPEATGGLAHRLWLIYQYNFSDQDVMIFLLPLFFTGLIVRLLQFKQGTLSTKERRTDLIFLAFTAVFLFVNWHEAFNIHGFRLTVPVILPLIYFSYWGAHLLLLNGTRLSKTIFATTFVLFAVFYTTQILNIQSYGSVIADAPIIGALLRYKLVIFLVIFALAAGFMLLYSQLRWARKQVLLGTWVLFLFAVKFAPFALDARASQTALGYDYGLAQASPHLAFAIEAKRKTLTNVNPYTLDYYAGQLNLTNEGSYPFIRTFRQRNVAYMLHQREVIPVEPEVVAGYGIHYVLFVNKTKDDVPDLLLRTSLIEQPALFHLIHEAKLGEHIQWELYEFDLAAYQATLPPPEPED
ncbi:hypothetical protein HY374_03205 [Candidatus Berkelbacteria bacterium]|nr:hypothetical protein [Candidatus Berkelbacteria bacterium]